jgi:hypothetical protein
VFCCIAHNRHHDGGQKGHRHLQLPAGLCSSSSSEIAMQIELHRVHEQHL